MANESRHSQMLRGVLDICLLAVLDAGPAYGYEMTKRLRDRGLASVGEGSIYPLMGPWAGSRDSPQIRSQEFPTLARA